MLPGEAVGFDGVTCDCGRTLKLQVLSSAAGWYLGYACGECGPYARESGYYPDGETAKAALDGVTGANPLMRSLARAIHGRR